MNIESINKILNQTNLSNEQKLAALKKLTGPQMITFKNDNGQIIKTFWSEDNGVTANVSFGPYVVYSKTGRCTTKTFLCPGTETICVITWWDQDTYVNHIGHNIRMINISMVGSVSFKLNGDLGRYSTFGKQSMDIDLTDPAFARPPPVPQINKAVVSDTVRTRIVSEEKRHVYYVDASGKKQGAFLEYYLSGRPRTMIWFSDGKLNGLSITWHDQDTDGHDRATEQWYYNGSGSETRYYNTKGVFNSKRGMTSRLPFKQYSQSVPKPPTWEQLTAKGFLKN